MTIISIVIRGYSCINVIVFSVFPICSDINEFSLENKIRLAAPTETPIFMLKTLYTNTNKRFRATLLQILHVRRRRNPRPRASLFRHTASEMQRMAILQWNLDLTKSVGTGQICSLNEGFVISKTSI